MKRILKFSVVVLVGFVLGVYFIAGLSVEIGGANEGRGGGIEPLTTTVSGDPNGDGRVNIADPQYLVNFLFLGGLPPVAVADTPELLARVDFLETKVTELESDSALLQGNLDDLSATVASRSNKLAFAAIAGGGQAISVVFRADCAFSGERHRGPASFTFSAEPPPTVRNGEILESGIVFETDRPADLVVELKQNFSASAGRFSFFLDGSEGHLFSIPYYNADAVLTPIWAYALDVPAGEHTLTIIVDAQCGATGSTEVFAGMSIEWIVVRYLD